jgi:hypothetical protein
MEKSTRKRSIIIPVYLVIFSLVIFGIYSIFKPKPNCFDGVKNQNEEGVDCGGVCAKKCAAVIQAQDLVVEKIGIVPAGIAGKYDFYAQILNPNAVYGSKNFSYSISFKDSSGAITASKNGSSYILPGERKFIVENNLDVPTAETLGFKINNSDWIEFASYYQRPDINVINKTYDEISGGTEFAEAKGLLKNNSPFDFDTIVIRIILKDDAGNVLALNSTEMNTVNSGEQRDFRIAWPNSFPGKVASMEAQPEVNIFSSDAFVQKYYQAEKFQQY